MPELDRPYPSIPRAVMALLKYEMPGLIETVISSWPADATQRATAPGALPLVRVAGLGGTTDETTKSEPIDVDVLTSTWSASDLISRQIEQVLMAYPHQVRSGGPFAYLDFVTTIVGPQEVPWGDPNVRRFIASYRISARR